MKSRGEDDPEKFLKGKVYYEERRKKWGVLENSEKTTRRELLQDLLKNGEKSERY